MLKLWMRTSEKYFSKHPYFNAAVHTVAGVGIGFLFAYPMVGTHPIRWGMAFLTIGVLGHLWTFKNK